MAVTKLTGLGELTTNFLLNDFDVYIQNTSSTGGYASTDWALIGHTGAEKSVDRGIEKFTREAKIPRVPIYKKTIRKSLKVGFTLDNWNADIVPLFTQATKITVNGTTTKLSHGTDESAVEYRAIRFSTTLDNGQVYSLTIPKAELSQDGEQSVGGEENAVFPLVAEAVYNPSANNTGSLYYELYQSSGENATADVPPGYN